MIIIIDFGSQYTHLICRRVREHGVKAEIYPYNKPVHLKDNIQGIILSGSFSSIADIDSLQPDKKILNLKVPVLGICYGMQVMAEMLGGKVTGCDNREYGETKLKILEKNDPFSGFHT